MRARVFGLTWLAYASLYLGRKNFAVSKARLGDELHLGPGALGDIDTGFLAAYALGQFLWGRLGDRLGSRRLVGGGLLAAAAFCALAGSASGLPLLAAAWAANGLAQATGWSGNVKAMGAAFDRATRGRVMGLWSTCYQIGGLAATALAGFALFRGGWRFAFGGPALLVAATGVVVLLFLPTSAPTSAPTTAPTLLPSPSTAHPAAEPAGRETGGGTDETVVRPDSLWREPRLWQLGGAYFFLKLIRYSLLFWLPYYLVKELRYRDDHAAYLSVAFEVGGVVGSIVVGLLSDRLFGGARRRLAAVLSLALVGALLLYLHVAPLGPAANFGAMALCGFCLFGPDTLVSGAAAQDLGGARSTAAAAGFINGLGSLGAVLQGRVTATVVTHWGLSSMFSLLPLLAGAATVVLVLPVGRRPRGHEPRSV